MHTHVTRRTRLLDSRKLKCHAMVAIPTPPSILPCLFAISMLLGTTSASAQLNVQTGQFWNYNSPGIPGSAQEGDGLGREFAAGDFNCDGWSDLASSSPYRNEVRGVVLVQFGSASGLTSSGSDLLAMDAPADADYFGWALASGDFNQDGCADLAIGAPFRDIQEGDGSTANNAGIVLVEFGSAEGFIGETQVLSQNTENLAGGSEQDDLFGFSLAAGDINGDGYDELAIGVYGENDAGAVHLLFGSSSGLLLNNSQYLFLPGQDWLTDVPVTGVFGMSLAIGDVLDAEGSELVAGNPLAEVDGQVLAGSVTVIGNILSPGTFAQSWTQNTEGVPGAAEEWDEFGSDIAVGDFDGDGFDEIAAGAKNEDYGGYESAGAVIIMDLSPALRCQLWTKDDLAWLGGSLQADDFFGLAMASGDFNNDEIDDLAIGVPGYDAATDSGAAYVIHGSNDQLLRADGAMIFMQLTVDMPEPSDHFGVALVSGQFDGIGGSDLAIGSPGESIGSVVSAGAVTVHYSDNLFRSGFE